MSPSNHFSDSANDSLSYIVNNKEQIFEIIDSVISIESCIHYQFIPLAIKNNILTLGMINPEDRTGYNFIYPIVTSLNYTLKIIKLDSQIHQLILAAYLKKDLTTTQNNYLEHTIQSNLPKKSSNLTLNSAPTLIDTPDDSPHNNQVPNLHDRETLIVNPQETITLDNNSSEDSLFSYSPEIFSSDPQIIDNSNSQQGELSSNFLEVKAQHINESIDTLSGLPPQQLWQELLARILEGGIGRLYLERHPHYGRIIWSRDGVVQSSLEEVKIAVFNHIIEEIKLVAKQPLTPITKNKKVAVERFYNQERILLRIEFFLNQYGEEITVQILRDKALRFYEQRQAKRTMEQALSLSRKLDKVLKKMIFCCNSGELEHFSSLKAIFRQLERHITVLEEQTKNPQE